MERLFDNRDEHTEPINTTVKGVIPDWLSGKLFRLGPGKWDLGKGFTLNHWFDGCAILSSFNIEKGQVKYRSRYLNSEAYKRMTTVNRPVVTEFGTKCYPDPCKNIFSRFFASLVPSDLTDNNFGNVFNLGDELYCTSETCFVWKVDTDSLDAIQRFDINKLVSVNLASAHPQSDPDGTSYNLGASFITGLKYHIVKIPPPEGGKGSSAFKKASVIYNIPSSWKTTFSYYHSFGLTPNYIIFVEQPLLVNTMRLIASRVKGYSLKECFDWVPKERTKFVIVDRCTGQVTKIKYMADAVFFFHCVNAYEEDGHIVFDMIAYEDNSVMDKFYLEKLRNGEFDESNPGHFRRYVIPVEKDLNMEGNLVSLKYSEATAYRQDNSTVWLTHEEMGHKGFDLPTINYDRVNGKKYRYLYGSGNFEKGACRNGICKLDTMTREMKVWRESESQFPSEAIFVESPNATSEDDGVLIAMVSETRFDQPDFVIFLDAKTFTEIARAEVSPDIQLPSSIHGCFMKS